MTKLSADELDVKGKKVFLRVDFNVPLTKTKEIADSTRVDLAIPGIKSLLARGARLALVSHLGRPTGDDPKFSLAPIARYISDKLQIKVKFCPEIIGDSATLALNSLQDGECLMFENIRFYAEEEANDKEFSAKIAEYFDCYVNDAFGTAHRAHASTHGVASFFNDAAAGRLMHSEIEQLEMLLNKPKAPFVAVLGGAKIKDKLKVIQNLLTVADQLLIGGGNGLYIFESDRQRGGKINA